MKKTVYKKMISCVATLLAICMLVSGYILPTTVVATEQSGSTTGSNVSAQSEEPVSRELRFDKNGEFKLLILSDLRLSADVDPSVIKHMEQILDQEQPDLVLLGGDLHDGTVANETDLRTVLDAVNQPLQERQILWCHTFGVDAEGTATEKTGYSKEAQMAVYQSYPYCISVADGEDVYGVSNYVLPIKLADSETVGFNVWCLDGNGYLNDYQDGLESQVLLPSLLSGQSNLDCLHTTQRLWYWNTSMEFQENNGGEVVPGMMYFQVPPYQFRYIIDNQFKTGMTGTVGEALTAPERDSGIVWTCYERGDIRGIFCGYNEANDFAGTYLDMLFAACSTIGKTDDASTAGARVVTISDHGATMKSSMVHLSDINEIPVELSTDKTIFAQGEGISIRYDNLDASWKTQDIELRLDQGHDLPGNLAGVSAVATVDLTLNPDGSDAYRGSGADVVISQNHVNTTWPLAAGAYTVWVCQYAADGETVAISNKVEIEIKPMTITTTKTVFYQGEDIVVAYDGLENSSHGIVELRMDYGWNLTQAATSYAFADFYTESYTGNDVYEGDAGTKSFPANDARVNGQTGQQYIQGKGYPVGKYTLWIRDDSAGKAFISNKIEIEIVPVSISTTKTVFARGEDIVVTYAGLHNSENIDVELRMEPGWGLSATSYVQTYAYGDLFASTDPAVNATQPDSGSICFPDNDYRYLNNSANTFVSGVGYPAGKYTLRLRNERNTVGIISNVIEIEIVEPEISLESHSTTYVAGEPIVVHYDYFSEIWKAREIELRIDKGHNLFGSLSGIGSEATIELTLNSDNSDAYRGLSADVSFPEDNIKTTWPLAPGDYTIWMFKYGDDRGTISNRIEITVVGPTISLESDSTTFGVGESIVVDYLNFHEAWTNQDIELRIDSGHGLTGTLAGVASKSVIEMTKDVDNNEADCYRGAAASVSFPEDISSKATWPLAAGDYTIWMFKYGSGNARGAISNKIEITIVDVAKPTLTLNDADATFIYGEGISFTYAQMNQAWFPDNGLWMSVAIMRENETVDQQRSVLEHIVYTDDDPGRLTWTPTELSAATIEFPETDNGNSQANWPLAAGKYYAVVRIRTEVGNRIFDETVCPFEVVAPKAMAQPELRDSITMHYTITVGDTFTETPSMKFTLGDRPTVEVTEYTTTAGDGLVSYTFAFENILPQQMTDNLAAEFYVGKHLAWSKETYSLQTYATNKLADPDSASAHTLLVAMLNYGAEAQKYFNYKTDRLANAVLTTAQAGLLTNVNIANATAVETKVDGPSVAGYTWRSVTLNLQSTLSFRLKFEAADIDKVVIKNGNNTWTYAANEDAFASLGNNMYYFYFPNIFANQFDTTFDIVMEVDGQQAQTVHYSVNSFVAYIANKVDTELKDMCTAVYNYGLQAKAYGNQEGVIDRPSNSLGEEEPLG